LLQKYPRSQWQSNIHFVVGRACKGEVGEPKEKRFFEGFESGTDRKFA
jgi:hypothetical protein